MSVFNNTFAKLTRIHSNFSILRNILRSYSSKEKRIKVTVCGAGGNVGQPLSLILKQSPLINELALYDADGISGFGMELGHVDTKCKVLACSGTDSVRDAFQNSNIVVVVAAAPKTAYLAHSAMFEANANIMKEIAESFATHCPNALLAIATNPVNSLVPLASEIIRSNGKYDPKTVFGITALDVVRANTFVAEVQGLDPESVVVPVIGGCVGKTIIPVLSHAKPCSNFSNEQLECLTKSVQNAHFDIIQIKNQKGATLSAAFAIARFVSSLIKGIHGQRNVVECAYVRSKEHPHIKYLSTPLLLGPGGILKNLGIPELSEYENCQLENAVQLILADVRRGECFVGVVDPPPCDPCDPDPLAYPCPPNWCAKDSGCR